MTKETIDAVTKFEQRGSPVSAIVPENSPSDIVMAAIQKNYEPAFIEKMMDLQERHERNIAKKAHFEAVADFKAEAPPVKKDKWNDWFKSWYTGLGQLLDTYNPHLGKHGLSLSFPTPAQDEKSMTVECRLAHRLGHVESVSMTGPIDQAAVGKESGKRSRNALQDIKSTFTYLRGATCEAILGVAGTEGTQDDDGNAAGKNAEYISTDQVTEINDLIKETGANRLKFFAVAKTDSTEKILQSAYPMLIKQLKDRQDKLLKEKQAKTREPGQEG